MVIRRNYFLPAIAAILLFVVLGPYFVWGLISNDVFLGGVGAILAFLFLKNNEIKKNAKLFVFISFVMVLYCLTSGVSFFGFIFLGFSVFVAFGKEDFTKKTFNIFINIYAAILLISSLVWIGVLLGLVSPIGNIAPLNELNTFDYTVYPLTVQMNSLYAFRFCGPFEEPGVIGTMNVILLFILDMNRKDWKTYALILSGALSLSLFFYIGVFLFFLIKNITKLRIIYLLIIALFIVAFYEVTKDNEILSERVWERVEWNKEEGTFAGNNRMDYEADKIYESKKWSLDWWIGDRNFNSYASAFEGSSSYKVVVLRCGMICFALYVLFFLLYAHKYCKGTKMLLFTVLFLTTIYQRPWMFGIGYFFLLPYYARFNYNEGRIENVKIGHSNHFS